MKVTFEQTQGHGRGYFRGRGRGRTGFNKVAVECYKCHNLGHFQYESPDWNNKANYAELREEEELFLMAHVELKRGQTDHVWFRV